MAGHSRQLLREVAATAPPTPSLHIFAFMACRVSSLWSDFSCETLIFCLFPGNVIRDIVSFLAMAYVQLHRLN